jgi:pentatricopeptide repeat protein
LYEGAGKNKEALTLKQNLLDQAMQIDSRTLNQLITKHVKAGEFEEAESLYECIGHRSEILEDGAAALMISLYGQKGQYEKARELFLSLWQRSAPQSLYIHNTMIGVCIKCKQIGDAVQIFEDMEKRGMAYDDVTVSTMVNAYSKAGLSGANPSLNKQSNTCGTP